MGRVVARDARVAFCVEIVRVARAVHGVVGAGPPCPASGRRDYDDRSVAITGDCGRFPRARPPAVGSLRSAYGLLGAWSTCGGFSAVGRSDRPARRWPCGWAVHVSPSWQAEDRVCADSPPYDMRLTRPNLVAVLEGRAAVLRPRHLPHTGVALNPLDAQTRMEALAATGNVGDELRHCSAEGSLLLRSEPVPIAPERREDFTCRHRAVSCARPGPLGTARRSRSA